MLNFENEMKAANTGYVVLSLEEYNRLRDEAAAATKALAELVNVQHEHWSKEWVVVLDSAAIYVAAKEQLERLLGDNMREHDLKDPKDFAYYQATIATRKHPLATNNDDADDILNSDD